MIRTFCQCCLSPSCLCFSSHFHGAFSSCLSLSFFPSLVLSLSFILFPPLSDNPGMQADDIPGWVAPDKDHYMQTMGTNFLCPLMNLASSTKVGAFSVDASYYGCKYCKCNDGTYGNRFVHICVNVAPNCPQKRDNNAAGPCAWCECCICVVLCLLCRSV